MEGSWLSSVFLNSEDSDIEIRIETEKKGVTLTVPGHSLVLKQVSKVFRAMLEEDKFKESLTKVVELNVYGDVDDAISFMRYLYTMTLREDDEKSYVALMQTGHMYEIKDLLGVCEKQLSLLVTPFSVCKTFSALEKISTENFRTHCLDLMLKSAFLIFNKNLHLCVSAETMMSLLKSDYLNILDEGQALEALWNWASMKSRLEKRNIFKDMVDVMKDILPFVRWPLIENVATEETWSELLRKKRSEQADDVQRRSPSGKIHLAKFAMRLEIFKTAGKFEGDIQCLKMESRPAVRFYVSRDIVLAGFDVFLRCDLSDLELLFDSEYFKISVNSVNVTALLTWSAFKANALTIDDTKYFTYSLNVEFLTPLRMLHGNTNTIDIHYETYHSKSFYLPVYTVPNSVAEGTGKFNSDIQFHFIDEVFGVSNILYFVLK